MTDIDLHKIGYRIAEAIEQQLINCDGWDQDKAAKLIAAFIPLTAAQADREIRELMDESRPPAPPTSHDVRRSIESLCRLRARIGDRIHERELQFVKLLREESSPAKA